MSMSTTTGMGVAPQVQSNRCMWWRTDHVTTAHMEVAGRCSVETCTCHDNSLLPQAHDPAP